MGLRLSGAREHAFLLAGIAATAAYAFAHTGAFGAGFYSAIATAATLALLVGARRIGGPAARPWLCFAAGIAAFTVGDTIWDVRDLLGWDTGSPSLADGFYLLGYPLLGLGFALLLRGAVPGRVRTVLMDATILTVALAAVLWRPYFAGLRDTGGQPLSARLTTAAYPTFDFLLLALATGFVFSRPLRRRWTAMLVVAVLLLLGADLVWAVAPDSYSAGNWTDRAWLLSYVLWGAAALDPSAGAASDAPADSSTGLAWHRFVVLAVPVAAMPVGVVGFEFLGGYELSFVDGLLGSALLVLLLLRLAQTIYGLDGLRRALSRQNEALVQSEERFRRVYSDAGVGLAMLEPTGRIVSVNDALCRIAHATADEMVGRNLFDFVHEADAAAMREGFVGGLAEGGRVGLERRFRALDGSELWAVTGFTVLDYEGAPLVVASLQDISTRKRAEAELAAQNERLAASEERFRRLFQEAGVGLALLDESGRIVDVNRAFCAVARRGADEMVGADFSGYIRPEDVGPIAVEFGGLLERGSAGPIEVSFEAGDGSDRSGLVGGIVLADPEDAEHPLVIVDLQDITQRKVAEAELAEKNRLLEESDRLKDELISVVSHDLRTPLTSIVGYLELALEDDEGDVLSDQRRDFLLVAQRNSERLSRLVEDLLFVSRAQAGRVALDLAPVDLAVVVADVVEAARPAAVAAGLDLELAGEAGGSVLADWHRVAEAVENLLSNALKFTPEGGRVEVRLVPADDTVAIAVSDTGPGIPAEDAERIFDRFYRVSGSEGLPGAGLGLSIVKAIVETHGGTISVESRLGEGTTFELRLPRQGPSRRDSEADRMERVG